MGIKPSLKAPTMAPREPSTLNTDNPQGKFGLFLRDWLLRKGDLKGEKLGEKLNKGERTIRGWARGEMSPPLADLDTVAAALGFKNWAKLAAAVERFCEENPA